MTSCALPMAHLKLGVPREGPWYMQLQPADTTTLGGLSQAPFAPLSLGGLYKGSAVWVVHRSGPQCQTPGIGVGRLRHLFKDEHVDSVFTVWARETGQTGSRIRSGALSTQAHSGELGLEHDWRKRGQS